jgi:uncharacterized membrane protein
MFLARRRNSSISSRTTIGARLRAWRDRTDRTTNWAITCVAAMLSISWSGPAHHHEILLFAMIIVLLLLVIESRRYRFFDVYRRRVRTIEQHYYAQIFKPEIDASLDRMSKLGDDLRLPTFVISRSKAFCRCRPRQTSIGGALEERIWELILTNPRVEFSDIRS